MLWFDNFLDETQKFRNASEEDRKAMTQSLQNQIKTRKLNSQGLKEMLADIEELSNTRNKIFQPIKDWCEKYYYADFLVTIKADGCNYTTVLYGGDLRDHDTYSFLDDWDEGQKEVELVGFIPIDSIEVHINGENFPSNIVLHLYENGANYETVKLKGD